MSSRPPLTTLQFLQYARKSSDREDRQVQSLSDQAAALERTEIRDRLHVYRRFEESRSAKVPDNRPKFSEMIGMLERGEANAILCWHVNRLVRNHKEAGHLEQLVVDGKICCIKTPEREYWSDDDSIYLALETAQAVQYSRNISRDVLRGTEEKAARGTWPYRSKHGYKVNPDTHEVEIDPRSFSLLKEAWDRLASETYAVPEIHDFLNEAGFLVKASQKRGYKGPSVYRPISRTSLYDLFHDPFYTGHFLYKGVLRRGNHEPMVGPHDFEKVQRFLAKGELKQNRRHAFAYTGLMTCGHCGCAITAEEKVKRYRTTGTERRYTYYRCTGQRGCRPRYVPDSFFDASLLAILPSSSFEYDMVHWAVEELRRGTQQIPVSVDRFDLDQRRELEVAKKRLDGLFEMREQREITAEQFADRKHKLSVAINSLTMAIAARTSRRESILGHIEELAESLPSADRAIKEGGPEEKRKVAKLVAEKYVLTLDNDSPNLAAEIDPLLNLIHRFELQSPPSQQVEKEGFDDVSPVWRAFLDQLGTLIYEANGRSIDDPGSITFSHSA